MAVAGILKDEHVVSTAIATAGIGAENYSSILAACRSLQTNDIASLIQRVELHKEKIGLTICLLPILIAKGLTAPQASIIQDVPMLMKRRGIETRLVIGNQQDHEPCVDNTLIKAIAKARCWFDELSTGRARTFKDIAVPNNVSERYVGTILPLAFLAPEIVEDIIAGRQPADLTAEALIRRTNLPTNWPEQRQALGFH